MKNVVRRLWTNKLAFVGLIAILTAVLVALLAPVIAPYDPTTMDTVNRFAPAGAAGHILGTDEFGRDVFSRIIYGSRISLLVAATAVLLASLIGGTVGLTAGYVGGAFDNIVMRIMDVFFAIPAMMVALGVVGVLGPSAKSVTIALGVAYTPLFSRIIRSTVVSLRSQGFIEAARAMGSSEWRVMAEDVIPNIVPVLTVQITASLAWGILDEASLGFLGLGVQPPTPSWGAILTTGRQFFHQAPTVPIFAGLAVLVVVFSFNLFGDGLRDLLDPRAWQRGQ